MNEQYLLIFQEENKQQEHNVVVLVDFAVALMTVLDQINRESFQRFKLRIGWFFLFSIHVFIIKNAIKCLKIILNGSREKI